MAGGGRKARAPWTRRIAVCNRSLFTPAVAPPPPPQGFPINVLAMISSGVLILRSVQQRAAALLEDDFLLVVRMCTSSTGSMRSGR